MRTAFVTGGTGSIGQAIVERLAADGHQVHFQYFSNESVAEGLQGRSADILAHRIDLASAHLVLPEIQADVVVNCAGVLLTKTPVHEIGDEEWNATFAINVTAPFKIVRKYLPGMIDRGFGRIVNVGSIYAERGSSNNASYNVSKHALLGLTRSVTKDVARMGITCNQVDPSAVEGEIMNGLARRYESQGKGTAVEYLDAVREAIPAGRMAEPTEVAGAVAYLISEEAGFVNGACLTVDGGLIC